MLTGIHSDELVPVFYKPEVRTVNREGKKLSIKTAFLFWGKTHLQPKNEAKVIFQTLPGQSHCL